MNTVLYCCCCVLFWTAEILKSPITSLLYLHAYIAHLSQESLWFFLVRYHDFRGIEVSELDSLVLQQFQKFSPFSSCQGTKERNENRLKDCYENRLQKVCLCNVQSIAFCFVWTGISQFETGQATAMVWPMPGSD